MVALSSCGGSGNGELIGVQGREAYFPGEPYGMVFVPQGNFQAGQSDQDVMFSLNAPTKTVSVGAFYMDETEITNNEYRQFVQWVADSIAHTKLNHIKEGPAGEKFIDWEQEIKWNDEALKDMYYAGDDQVFGKQELDVRKLTYLYQWYDLNNAAHNKDVNAKRNKIGRAHV